MSGGPRTPGPGRCGRPLGALILMLSLLVPLTPVALAQGPGMEELIRNFAAAAASKDPQARRQAALAVLSDYSTYQHLVAEDMAKGAGSRRLTGVARKLDEELVTMCRETWGTVGAKMGSGLDHVVPVGTLGNRLTDPAYLPGKSDKDFIPRGPASHEAAGEFGGTFRAKFGIDPGSVQVNVLDPTDPKTWPARYEAATNPEKYNTIGGNTWLAVEESKQKPNLWRFDPTSGQMKEVYYESIAKGPAPSLTKGDAMGWFSDNSRFRSKLIEDVTDPTTRALKQAKYDLRNLDAFMLAGGKLTDEERRLFSAASALRSGQGDRAVSVMMAITGETDPERAVAAYLRSMDDLTASMGKTITESHIVQMSRPGIDAATRLRLADELAASISNLSRPERIAAVDAMTKALGKTQADEIIRTASTFERRVTWGLTYFDDKALESFGQPYGKLSEAERNVLHGADDVAESFLGKVARVTGWAFSGYAVYNAYEQGSKEGGTGVGVASALARAMLEALQSGVPMVAAAELVAQLTAGVIQLGETAWKNETLERLYALYKGGERDILDTEGAVRGYAGGLREFAKELRMNEKGITDAQIEARLKSYFARRLAADLELTKVRDKMTAMLQWGAMRGVFPEGILGLDDLTAEEAILMRGFYEAYLRVRAQLEADDISGGVTDEMIYGVLWHLYNPAGTAASYQAAMRSLYATFKMTYPPKDGTAACPNKPVVKTTRNTTVVRKQPPPPGGVLLSGSGGWTQKIDSACDPAVPLGPVELTCGGTIKATIDGNAVPCTWALKNNGISLWVGWIPSIGRADGPAQELVNAALACEGNPGSSHLVVSADVPGPGRLVGWIGAPAGAGPLTAECFAGGGSATVTMVSPRNDAPAMPSDMLSTGDRLVTGDNGTAVLLVPGFASVRIRGRSDVAIQAMDAPTALEDATCGPGVSGVDLTKGALRLRTLPRGKPLPVSVGGRTVSPDGTDLVVEATADGGGRVLVLDGTASIAASDGTVIVVPAGSQMTWPGDVVTVVADTAADPSLADLSLDDTLLDDTTPVTPGSETVVFGATSSDAPSSDAPSGTSDGNADGAVGAASVAASLLPDGWTLVDAGSDSTVAATDDGRGLLLTVPDGNDLWAAAATAPMLLRKVSGDVDLEASVTLESVGPNLSTLEFMVASPGSQVGALQGQMASDGPAADLAILGGGWLRYQGENRLSGLVCADINALAACPAAPDPAGPVRLRLSRRGDTWRTFRATADGRWILTTERDIRLPETLWVGWVTKRMAFDGLPAEPARATIADVSVVSAPWGSLAPPTWVARTDTGVIPLDDGGVSLSLDGTATGQATADTGRTLEGGFEVIARIDPVPWTRVSGETRSLALEVSSRDGLDQAYVAFNETEGRRGFAASAMTAGAWGPFTELRIPDPAATWYRLSRTDGHVAAAVWADCRWLTVATSAAVMDAPVAARVVVANEWEASVPAALEATVHLARIADGPHLADVGPWAPDTCSVTAAEALPADLILPEGTTATTMRAPFPLGRVFFGPDGIGYAVSSSRDRTALLALDPDGTTRIASESPLFSGLNRKSLAWLGGRLLVAVDYWPDGGNVGTGIEELGPDGTALAWPGPADAAFGPGAGDVDRLGGITDLSVLPDGGLLVTDFEADQVFRLSPDGSGVAPLITVPPAPAGPLAAIADPAIGTIDTLDVDGAWPLGGPAGIARITPDGASVVTAAPPADSSGFGGMARSDGRVLPAGLYVTEPAAGRVLLLAGDGTFVPVITGLRGVTELAFDAATGDLLLTYDATGLMRVSKD